MPDSHAASPREQPTQRSRQRAAHHKSRAGCYTCKLRRVKCDELKPVCQRCQAARRQCLSDTRPSVFKPVAIRSLGRTAPEINFELSEDSKASLRYFYAFTLPALQSRESSPLWDHLRRELQHSRSICYLAVALGYEHEKATQAQHGTHVPDHGQALCNRATDALQEIIANAGGSSSASTSFMTVFHCLLLMILHCFRKSFDEMNVHLQHGLRIAFQALEQYDAATDYPLRACFRMLKDYCIAIALFNPLLPQETSYNARVAASTNVALQQPAALKSENQSSANIDVKIADDLSDLILDLIATTITLRRPKIDDSQGGDLVYSTALRPDEDLRQKAEDFRTRCYSLDARIDERLQMKHKNGHTLQIIKVQCLLVSAYARCRWSGYQSQYDMELDTYQEAIEMLDTLVAELTNQSSPRHLEERSLPLSLGFTVISCLSHLVRMCREDNIRRKALQLMSRLPEQYGPWDCRLVVAITKTVVSYEKGLAAIEIGSAWTGYIPEPCRVHHAYYLPQATIAGSKASAVRMFRAREDSRTILKHEDVNLIL